MSDAVEDSDAIPPSEVSTALSTSQNLTPSVTPNVDNQQTAVTHRYPRRSHRPPQRYHTLLPKLVRTLIWYVCA